MNRLLSVSERRSILGEYSHTSRGLQSPFAHVTNLFCSGKSFD